MILSSLLYFGILLFSNSDTVNPNGWEFLDWYMQKTAVDKLLAAHKISYIFNDAKVGSFRYDDFRVWIVFDDSLRLNNVRQKKSFHVHQLEEAKQFFEVFEQHLYKKFGEPISYHEDKERENVRIHWQLTHTDIELDYDYAYKVIDELGADSYWVELDFKPR